MILEYLLNKEFTGMRAPSWVEDGGYFRKSDHTLIGWSPDESKRQYYIPDTVLTLTRAQLKTRVLNLHAANKFQKPDNSDMSTTEVEAMVDAWCNTRGEP